MVSRYARYTDGHHFNSQSVIGLLPIDFDTESHKRWPGAHHIRVYTLTSGKIDIQHALSAVDPPTVIHIFGKEHPSIGPELMLTTHLRATVAV